MTIRLASVLFVLYGHHSHRGVVFKSRYDIAMANSNNCHTFSYRYISDFQNTQKHVVIKEIKYIVYITENIFVNIPACLISLICTVE